MNMISLIKVNIKQFLSNYFMLVILFFATPFFLFIGFVFSNEGTLLKYKVGIDINDKILSENIKSVLEESERFNCTLLDNELNTNKNYINGYVAIVKVSKDQKIEVLSEDNKLIATEILWRLGESEENEFRVSTLKKTVGFFIVFILMASKLLQGTHYIERENGILMRLLSGKVSAIEYLISQLIANFIEVVVPVVLSTLIYSYVFPGISKWSIGDILKFEIIISLLASCFSCFIFYSFKDKMTIEFVSSLVILSSSIWGGCLIDINDDDKIVGIIRGLLPQKIILNMLEEPKFITYFLYLGWILLFTVFGIFKGRRLVCKK